ncbi:TlpA family protein disulfide reductase [Vibrio ostreicida]|uniref:TlpA disulfide reductase family protein n=1 Tax=Vibrio ostreicida TaxID=526588 RepID=A0ABT8BV78_9VIBR|nr:TlpA disulfide reductase family protein [Vibrio ostreicida]MDN3611081.1 TlpA disulfide reductase family protein [Vibrio ostreicida]MDN3611830.1 TlpA disulfide reductase family protein [Vibrio ostreicida]NPD09643.1 TlpA family protein disulfide reductase [Vibrio ostreicida]
MKSLSIILTSLWLATPVAASALPEQTANLQSVTLSGRQIDLAELKGKKPVYLKFWATWCSYCKEEMPHLQAIKNQYGDDIEVISINVGLNQTPQQVTQYMQNHQYDLPVVFDRDGLITQSFDVVGTPHHILIDRQGNIAYRTFLATDKLDAIIDQWSNEK